MVHNVYFTIFMHSENTHHWKKNRIFRKVEELYKITFFVYHQTWKQNCQENEGKLAFRTTMLLLLRLSHFSRVRRCVTPETAAHQAPPSLGFSRHEHWSGLPFPSPMQESEKWKWSCSVVSDSSRPHGLQPTRLLHPWDFPGKSPGVGGHCLLQCNAS